MCSYFSIVMNKRNLHIVSVMFTKFSVLRDEDEAKGLAC